MHNLFVGISKLCKVSRNPVVLLVDEVDSASNNQVFMSFLSMLRGYYLDRKNKDTFHSVILAGVYDIKNLKLKLRSDSEHQYNSPWNIAVEFDIDMSLSANQIADMEGFENAGSAWTKAGMDMALKILIGKHTSQFDSMTRQMSKHPDLKRMLKAVVFQGKRISYNLNTHEINLAAMFGYIKDSNGSIQIANRIFETLLCNLFLSEEELTEAIYDKAQAFPSFSQADY